MSFIDVIFQAIIQGLTEFLPVSSSGHVSLYQHISGNSGDGSQTFTLLLHLGTLVAVFVAYRKLIAELIIEFFKMCGDAWKWTVDRVKVLWLKATKKPFEEAKASARNMPEMNNTRRMVVMVIVASAWAILLFLPVFSGMGLTMADGETVEDMADLSTYFSEDKDILAEGVFLLVTGGMLLYATYLSKCREGSEKITLKNASAMGIAQCFASMPGISRSGSTTTAGMISGLDKNTALNMSFIMSIPAVLAATLLDIKDEFIDTPAAERITNFTAFDAVVGIIISAVVGILAIVGLKWIVSNNKLNYFGWYCLAMGFVVIVVAIIEYSTGNNIFTGESIKNVTDAMAVSGTDAVSLTDISASDIFSASDIISATSIG